MQEKYQAIKANPQENIAEKPLPEKLHKPYIQLYQEHQEKKKREQKGQRVPIYKAEEFKNYKDKYLEYKLKKKEEHVRKSLSPRDKHNFELYKSTSPNPKRSHEESKWDPEVYVDYRRSLMKNESKSPRNFSKVEGQSALHQIDETRRSREETVVGKTGLKTDVTHDDDRLLSERQQQESANYSAIEPEIKEPVLSESKDLNDFERKLLRWIFSIYDSVTLTCWTCTNCIFTNNRKILDLF